MWPSGHMLNLGGSYDMRLKNSVALLPNMGRWRTNTFFGKNFIFSVKFTNGKT